ncbi:hypothetical protein HK405_000445 [Cladochytrium tenue]|nr:hypothetical protein HK405_000445 [Cladochytrium tenue]
MSSRTPTVWLSPAAVAAGAEELPPPPVTRGGSSPRSHLASLFVRPVSTLTPRRLSVAGFDLRRRRSSNGRHSRTPALRDQLLQPLQPPDQQQFSAALRAAAHSDDLAYVGRATSQATVTAPPPPPAALASVINLSRGTNPLDVALSTLSRVLSADDVASIRDPAWTAADFISIAKANKTPSLPRDLRAAASNRPNMFFASILTHVESAANAWHSAADLQCPLKTTWALYSSFYEAESLYSNVQEDSRRLLEATVNFVELVAKFNKQTLQYPRLKTHLSAALGVVVLAGVAFHNASFEFRGDDNHIFFASELIETATSFMNLLINTTLANSVQPSNSTFSPMTASWTVL